MGSVKDLKVLQPPQADQLGFGYFIFSDRYSVFDWGEMPDHIPYKGASLALMGGWIFEVLEKEGIPTHYRGMVEDGKVKRIKDLKAPSSTMAISLLRVLPPSFHKGCYDYQVYQSRPATALIPLEVIYRNVLPPGSSVFKRLEAGTLTPQDLGLKVPPKPGQGLPIPMVDFSTKLEATDRYLSKEEAKAIANLTEKELETLITLTIRIDQLITALFSPLGLDNLDGKMEFGWDTQHSLLVVDVVGTLDECRFAYEDLPVSKEIARGYYRQTPWYEALQEAKKQDPVHWKQHCQAQPKPLPEELKRLISHLYAGCTNALTGRTWFKVPPLEATLKNLASFLEAL